MRFDKLPYVDLTKPWWNMNAGEYFRIDDKLYFMAGDYVLYEKQRLPAMMVNLSMAEDYEIEDLYAAVDEVRWTVDLMNTYTALVKGDIDGASPRYVFEEGRALFYNEVLSIVRTLDTNIRYGVLPLPKYDETQKKYLSTVQNSNSGSIAIPASLSDEDAEFTGLILEAPLICRTTQLSRRSSTE